MNADLYPHFSKAEQRRRRDAVGAAMDREGVEALVVYGPPSGVDVPYLINYLPAGPCWLIWPRDGEPTAFVHFYNHIPCTRAQATVDDVRWYGPAAVPTVADELRRRGLERAALGIVSLNAIPYNDVVALQQRLPDTRLVEFGRALAAIRSVHSDEELPFVRRSGELTDRACEALAAELRPGLTEHQVRAIVTAAYSGDESDPGIHFIASTSMSAPDRFVPWQRVTPRTLQRGDVVITELTVSYWGYSTQIHRPFAIGAEPTPLYRALFDAAFECYERIRSICVPGTTSEQIVAASAVIEERGFTTYDSVFHGQRGKFPELGTPSAVHPLEPWTLRENMVHVIQPNPVTRDDTAGLQLGAAVLITPTGGEALHRFPFVFSVCG